MIIWGEIKLGNILQLCCAAIFLCFSANIQAQTKNYATVLVGSDNTDDVPKAHDSDLATFASVRSYAGLALGLGAYTGFIELDFPSVVPANTTTYVRIRTEIAAILPALLSGGNSSYTGSILIGGSQEFSVTVKDNSNNPVVSGGSQNPGELATIKLTVVINGTGEYFLKITPDVGYKRIRLTNKMGALLLGDTKRLYVHDAYYLSNFSQCNHPVYTNYSVSGSLMSAQASLTEPEKAVDTDLATFSAVTIAALPGGQSIQQTVYLETLSNSGDTFGISLSATQAMITAGIANNVSVIAYNGTTAVQTLTLAQLLTSNSATLVGGQVITLNMVPGAYIDRITLRVTAIAGGGRSINFHKVTKKPPLPVITLNNPVCEGSTGLIIVTTVIPGASIKWYDSAAATNLLLTSASGQSVVTPVMTGTITLYVGVCEEFLIPVIISVITKPIAGSIAGDQTVCLTKVPVLLTSASADSGGTITYRWESSLDEVLWSPIPSSNTDTFQPPELLKSTFFRRITINTVSGVACESVPTNHIKVTTRNCIVYANPMVRQRLKNGT